MCPVVQTLPRWNAVKALGALVCGMATLFGSMAGAFQPPNQNRVSPGASPLDPPGDINSAAGATDSTGDNAADAKRNPRDPKPPGIWVLDFEFKNPRSIKVDIPGKGQRECWYLIYQVKNYTGEPRYFLPEFEFKNQEKGTLHKDGIFPKVQQQIIKLEDPTADPNDPETGYLRIHNSVTIARTPIPVSVKNGPTKPVTGVAIWDDIDPDSTRFSVFVTGLSNGVALADPVPPSKDQIVRRKTLQINFKRTGDKYNLKSGDVRFLPPAQWIYRATDLQLPVVAGGAKPASADKVAPEVSDKPKDR